MDKKKLSRNISFDCGRRFVFLEHPFFFLIFKIFYFKNFNILSIVDEGSNTPSTGEVYCIWRGGIYLQKFVNATVMKGCLIT